MRYLEKIVVFSPLYRAASQAADKVFLNEQEENDQRNKHDTYSR